MVVEDRLTPGQRATEPAATPYLLRCDLQVGTWPVELSWRRGRRLTAAVTGPDGREDVAAGTSESVSTGPDSVLWDHGVMPLTVAGADVTMARERLGRDRWAYRAHGPDGREWLWRPAGTLLADRMELVREPDGAVLVTLPVRTRSGLPRGSSEPPRTAWDATASLAEVLMAVMWSLELLHHGVLPKLQRVARGDFL